MQLMHRTVFLRAAVISCVLALPVASQAGILDRIKKKAEEATEAVREVRDDVETVTSVDERAEAEARAVQRDVESATDVEGRAVSAVRDSEPVRGVRESQAEIARVGSADERAEAQFQHETAVVERDLRNATDVERRAETAARSTEAGRTVVQAQRQVERAEQTDERIQANTERRVDDALGVSETERDVRATGRALRNLENALD